MPRRYRELPRLRMQSRLLPRPQNSAVRFALSCWRHDENYENYENYENTTTIVTRLTTRPPPSLIPRNKQPSVTDVRGVVAPYYRSRKLARDF